MFRKAPKPRDELFDEVAADRLERVTGRGRREQALYPPAIEEKPERPETRRLFWTPDEIAEQSH